MYLVYHMTSHDHLIRGYANLWVEAPYSMSHPDKSCDHKHFESGDVFNFSLD